MAKNLANIRIYGGPSSAVFVAPDGTVAPTTLAAPAVTYVELGWLSEDGVDFNDEIEKKKFKGHQGGATVATRIISTERSFKFQCLEETATTLGLMHPGSTGVTLTGVSNIHIPEYSTNDQREWVVDQYDGDIQKRYTCSGSTGGGTVIHKTDEMTVFEYVVDLLGPVEVVTDSPSIVYV